MAVKFYFLWYSLKKCEDACNSPKMKIKHKKKQTNNVIIMQIDTKELCSAPDVDEVAEAAAVDTPSQLLSLFRN